MRLTHIATENTETIRLHITTQKVSSTIFFQKLHLMYCFTSDIKQ